MTSPPDIRLTERYRVDDLVLDAPPGLIRRLHLNVLANGYYEMGEMALASALVRPGQRVLEFGGGIGIASRHLSRIAGPGKVLCIEANPEALSVAEAQLARDGLGVTCRWGMVVSALTEQMTLAVEPENFLASQPLSGSASSSGLSIPLHILSELIAEWQPEALVVDIEGGERGLFPETDLTSVHSIVLELHPAQIGASAALQVVGDLASKGLLADPGLVAGAVLGFSRAPLAEPPSLACLLKLFEVLAARASEPAELARAADSIPTSPLLSLVAAIAAPLGSAERIARLESLRDDPLAGAQARQTLALEALAASAFDRALALLEGLPRTGFRLLHSARALLGLRRPSEALPLALAAAEALPWLGAAHAMLSRAALASGRLDLARSALAKARAVDPATPGLAQIEARLAARR